MLYVYHVSINFFHGCYIDLKFLWEYVVCLLCVRVHFIVRYIHICILGHGHVIYEAYILISEQWIRKMDIIFFHVLLYILAHSTT